MSANTTIQEGGKGYPFGPVKCLMVEGDDGKYYPWFPEADRQLDSLSVDKNGIYQASKYGVYGWSRVSVNVPQTDSVTGKDPQTGQEVVVRPDPETGELVETVVPVEIRVTTLPTKTEYTNGETIDYSGMVVKGFLKSGEPWSDASHPNGVIPIGELTLPVTKADAQGTRDEESASSDLIQGNVPCTNFLTLIQHNANDDVIYTYTEAMFAVIAGSRTDMLGASNAPGDCLERYRRVPTVEGGTPSELNTRIPLDQQFTHNGKTVYWAKWGQGWRYDEVSIGNAPALNKEVAWTIVYGDITRKGVTQTIPVQWQRTGDGAILETSFDITVTGGE